ncbi:MAG: cyclic nucleotide-binding domain-containing protein [Deltaproteobacteria bacterium]|nr:MAG: cyclic nucleotide-binding domain-containing protein [Deltaproteobacteria bacterium]
MDKVDVLRRSRLFDMLSNEEVDLLASLSQLREFQAGEVVFEEGSEGDALYVIAEGEVEVVRKEGGAEKVLASLGAPEFFGEMSVIDKETRSATVRAKSPTRLLRLTVDNLMTFRKAYRDGFTFIVINIARILSHRLRETNAQLAARL